MRAATDSRLLDVEPGSTAAVVVDVINTGGVIDGITAHVIGLADEYVTTAPALLPLFPDSSGQLTLSLAVPPTHPAGRHPLTVEVVSHGARLPSQFLDIDLNVASRPGLRLAATPRMIRARRGARFVLELTNEGNVPLDVSLAAIDAERSTSTEFVPPTLRIEAGTVAPVLLNVRGPRMFTGGEIDRTVVVEASATRIAPHPDSELTAPDIPGNRETTVRLRQRPLISRGLLTALILASIVALWAGVFLLGLTKVFSGDPMTKSAPASFFVTAKTGAGQGTDGTAGPGGAAGVAGAQAAAAPAGSLPKTGQLPPGVGGQITGTVIAASDKQPVGRILVQAWRQARDKLEVVGSAATQADGTYAIAGLFPTSYYLKFTAAGYRTLWYPGVPTQAKATLVATAAQTVLPEQNVTITGKPASVSGTVDPGDTVGPVVTTVTARSLIGSTPTTSAPAKTAANGSYTLSNLPAPGSYELTFQTAGYRTSTLVDTLNGGDARLEPTITLGATTGQITGLVSDGNRPLGGATVTTTVGGQPLSVTTPTTGQVGAFTLENLPTPANYVVTFAAPGHGSRTEIVDLKAGTTRTGLNVNLAGGTGSVSGTLTDSNGNGLGGATVTVGGAAVTGAAGAPAPSTTTLTSDSGKGTFEISGLTAPGSYTLTFTLAGYTSASVPVSLSADAAAPPVTARLSAQLGGITGTVRQHASGSAAKPYVGAKVTATNGRQSWTATSSDSGGALPGGGYLITGLQPGSYSVTVTASGLSQQTGIVTVVAGKNQTLNLQVGG